MEWPQELAPPDSMKSGLKALLTFLFMIACLPLAHAGPLSTASRGRLAAGQPTWVLVEFDAATVERNVQVERQQRALRRDDAAIQAQLRIGYRDLKNRVETATRGPDILRTIDYAQVPVSAWLISSPQALQRIQTQPDVIAVHENAVLHSVSVSDLGFIGQPAAALAGGTGVGTTIVVIDGSLGTNFQTYPDFGTCTGINAPSSTCRVALYQTYYPSTPGDLTHGTNVAAIALGVAPGARLAMFDVFNGSSASAADVLSAINTSIAQQATLNIVAMNLSLGDDSSHSATCTSSVFRSAVNNARNAGILPIVAAGNNGSKTGLSEPACVPGVVSVGAVYDANYGSATWALPAGTCTDSTAPDAVTCFSQSANYLSLLAPGTFVTAPGPGFVQSGTSQATPHVTGAVAVLRARYPLEPLTQTLQRLQLSPNIDVDGANGRATPRLNLSDAMQRGTALVLSATGPTAAVAGTTSSYVLTARNDGPLQVTSLLVSLPLPYGATLQSATAGCSPSGGVVRCLASSLSAGAQKSFTITVLWSVTGPVYAQASVTSDQNNTAPASQQQVDIGTDLSAVGDAPLPAWAYVMLALILLGLATRAGAMPTFRGTAPAVGAS